MLLLLLEVRGKDVLKDVVCKFGQDVILRSIMRIESGASNFRFIDDIAYADAFVIALEQ